MLATGAFHSRGHVRRGNRGLRFVEQYRIWGTFGKSGRPDGSSPPVARTTLRVGNGNDVDPLIFSSVNDLKRVLLEIARSMTPIHSGKSLGGLGNLIECGVHCQRKSLGSGAAPFQVPRDGLLKLSSCLKMKINWYHLSQLCAAVADEHPAKIRSWPFRSRFQRIADQSQQAIHLKAKVAGRRGRMPQDRRSDAVDLPPTTRRRRNERFGSRTWT
jgi:hypothetical protein